MFGQLSPRRDRSAASRTSGHTWGLWCDGPDPGPFPREYDGAHVLSVYGKPPSPSHPPPPPRPRQGRGRGCSIGLSLAVAPQTVV